MNGKTLKMIILSVMLCLLMSLLIGSASAEGVTATFNLTKDPYAEEMLIAGSPYAMPGVSFDHQSGEYLGAQTVITAKELLKKIESGNQFATAFAVKLGLGLTKDQVAKNLTKLVEEYDQQIAKGNLSFEEPRFIVNGVNLVMNKNVEKIRLTLNADGTYSATMNGDQAGYRASIMIDADASVTIVYDEAGQTQIERRVANGKPTDFVITLDVSGSMYGDRGDAMLKALRVVLEEILHEEDNSVSIVFWSNRGGVMQVDVDNNGVQQVFTGKDGVTVNKLFDAELLDRYGNAGGFSLADATIWQLESLYQTGGSTEPDQGLLTAIDLLKALEQDDGRNTGVLLFTDGWADWYDNEQRTVQYEKQIAEDYGATLVNVSIGDEYDVEWFGRYLDPNSPNYYDDSQILKDKVLYYNIPKLSSQELADKVSEMFEVAFETITTESKKLQTETITDGVLAAYGAQLIETIPAGFQLVQLKDENQSYVVNGVDENGNTTIQFNLDKIVSGEDQVLSYCVIPTAAGNEIGVTTYMTQSETVLYARPVDRLNYLEEEQIIKIDLGGIEPDNDDAVRPELSEDVGSTILIMDDDGSPVLINENEFFEPTIAEDDESDVEVIQSPKYMAKTSKEENTVQPKTHEEELAEQAQKILKAIKKNTFSQNNTKKAALERVKQAISVTPPLQIPDELYEAVGEAILDAIGRSKVEKWEKDPLKMSKQAKQVIEGGLKNLNTSKTIDGTTYSLNKGGGFIATQQGSGSSILTVDWDGHSVMLMWTNVMSSDGMDALADYCAKLAQLNTDMWNEFLAYYVSDASNLIGIPITKDNALKVLEYAEKTMKALCHKEDANKLIKELGDKATEKLKSSFGFWNKNKFEEFVKEYVPNGDQILKAAEQYEKVKEKYDKYSKELQKYNNSSKTDKALQEYEKAYDILKKLVDGL